MCKVAPVRRSHSVEKEHLWETSTPALTREALLCCKSQLEQNTPATFTILCIVMSMLSGSLIVMNLSIQRTTLVQIGPEKQGGSFGLRKLRARNNT